jgi:hypothetical protein
VAVLEEGVENGKEGGENGNDDDDGASGVEEGLVDADDEDGLNDEPLPLPLPAAALLLDPLVLTSPPPLVFEKSKRLNSLPDPRIEL